MRLQSLLEIHQLKVVGSLSLCLGVATDIITAAALCYFLHNLRTGYTKDDSLVNTLTLFAVNTGVVTRFVCRWSKWLPCGAKLLFFYSAVSLATMILVRAHLLFVWDTP